MGVVEDVQPSFASRDEARAAVTNNNGIIGEGYAAAGEMTKDADDLYMAVVVYMPESVDNKANYRGEKVPTIDFGINLVATQLAHEEDSFDDSYDENATYVIGDKCFYFVRQHDPESKYGFLTTYDLVNKKWETPVLIEDCQSR